MCFPQATCNATAGWKTTTYKYATVRQGVRYHILFFCCKENLEQWERRTTRLSTDIWQLSDRTMGEQSAGHAIQIVPCLIFKVWHIFCSCSHFSWECWNMWNGLQQPQAKNINWYISYFSHIVETKVDSFVLVTPSVQNTACITLMLHRSLEQYAFIRIFNKGPSQ